ncbi:MAG: hypothetical protein ACLRMD_05450 [Ruminococcus sp.]
MRYVIAGAGPAGIQRSQNPAPTGRGTVKSSWYRRMTRSLRCMLHKYLGGERDAEGISFIPPGFFKQNNITWYQERQWSGWTVLRAHPLR